MANTDKDYKKFFYYRDHEYEGGWGVMYAKTSAHEGRIVAQVHDKNMAFVIAQLLNENLESNDMLKSLEEEFLSDD